MQNIPSDSFITITSPSSVSIACKEKRGYIIKIEWNYDFYSGYDYHLERNKKLMVNIRLFIQEFIRSSSGDIIGVKVKYIVGEKVKYN